MIFKRKFRNSINGSLILILLVSAFFRFYRIREYMTFLGDEGRDVLIVKRMLLDGKFTLLGPITSVGSIYMGPVYYYLTAPFLFLANFDPVGPAIMVALFSLLTIYLIYKFGRDFFDEKAGLAAAFTYGISNLSIIYGRSSWNPNVVPFFAILLIYSLLKVIIEKRTKFLILSGISLGILIQLHYVTFMFFIIIPIILIIIKPKLKLNDYALALIAFLIAYSPFMLFELRHDFVNTKGALNFIVKNNSPNSELSLFTFWTTIQDVFVRLFWRSLISLNAEITKIFIVLSIYKFFTSLNILYKKKEAKTAFQVMLIWLIFGVLAFGLYRGAIYDYYLGSLFPVPHILAGIFFYLLWKEGLVQKVLAAIFLILIVSFNIINSPFRIEPNNMLKNTKTISDFIIKQTENKPYNFALIATHNSDHAYRYFLELSGYKPVVIENQSLDPDRKTITGQLLVVCEEKICQPLGHPLWEIAGYGQAEIIGEWKVSTARVFKLIPYKPGS